MILLAASVALYALASLCAFHQAQRDARHTRIANALRRGLPRRRAHE